MTDWSELYWDIAHRFPFRQLKNIKWWFYHRFHPKHRYNLVKLPLKPGYYDCDTRLVSAMYELLKRFVEREMGGAEELRKSIKYWKKYIRKLNKIPADSRDVWKKDEIPGIVAQKDSLKAMLQIYIWYTEEKPAIEKQIEDLNDGEYKAHSELEQKIWQKDEEMLILLVKIRHHLWT